MKKPKTAPKAAAKASSKKVAAGPKVAKAPKLRSSKAAVAASGPAAGKAGPRPPLPSAAVLDRLFAVVTNRRAADPAQSHSARLLGRGTAKVAQKFGEEAVECLIEAVAGNVDALVAESADVLYHLLVMWVAAGVMPDQVWAELERREGVSGVVEKASRARPIVGTTKIP